MTHPAGMSPSHRVDTLTFSHLHIFRRRKSIDLRGRENEYPGLVAIIEYVTLNVIHQELEMSTLKSFKVKCTFRKNFIGIST